MDGSDAEGEVGELACRGPYTLRGYFGADYPPAEVARVGGAKETAYRRLVRERHASVS